MRAFTDHTAMTAGTLMISEAEGVLLEARARTPRTFRDAKPAAPSADPSLKARVQLGDRLLQTRLRTMQALAEVRFPRPGRKAV